MTAAVDAGEGALAQGEALVVTGEKNLLQRRGPVVEHGAAAAAVRPVRAEDLAPAPARHVAEGRRRADLHRRRVGPRAARRMQRGHRALRGGRAGDRHARRHRPDAHGVRARHPDRRRHREAAVERAVARALPKTDAARRVHAERRPRRVALRRARPPRRRGHGRAATRRTRTFDDPVFALRGSEVGAMWSMLCTRAPRPRGRRGATSTRTSAAAAATGTRATRSPPPDAAVHNRIALRRSRSRAGASPPSATPSTFARWRRMAIGPLARRAGDDGSCERRVQSQGAARRSTRGSSVTAARCRDHPGIERRLRLLRDGTRRSLVSRVRPGES